MSLVDTDLSSLGGSEEVNLPPAPRPLHRLAAVRRMQGVSRRALARRLNVDVGVVKQQEEETSDLMLSTLYRWQQMLDVPISELLVDAEESLSAPVLKRARMVRLMKTALSIQERSSQESIRRMAQNLVAQLIEVMPELATVSAWHAVGQRRRLDEYGKAAERRLTSDVFRDYRD